MAVHPETAGNAGLVVTRRSRETGQLVSVYRSNEAGIEDDPTIPWATLCETHSSVVCHSTRELALHHLTAPTGWCIPCRVAVTGECTCGNSGAHRPGEGDCELAETEPSCDCYGVRHAVGLGDCVLSGAEERAGYPTLTEAFERLRVQGGSSR